MLHFCLFGMRNFYICYRFHNLVWLGSCLCSWTAKTDLRVCVWGLFGACHKNNWREWLHLALVLGNPLLLDALGQEESVCTHLALGAVLSFPLEPWLGSQGCAPSPQSSRLVRLDTSSELQSNINVQSIMCTTGGFCVGSPALQDAERNSFPCSKSALP